MFPIGPLVNGAAIVAGGLLGLLLHGRFPDRVRAGMFHALGLSILLIGLKMALAGNAPLLVVVSMLSGAILGELVDIERFMARAGDALKTRLRSDNALFTDGLVNATVIFCTGTMAILGSFDEALRGDHTLLFAKSALDGSVAMILATTHGAGVILSCLPVALYEGLLVVLGAASHDFFTPDRLTQLTAVGGLLIIAIGLNMLGLLKIRVANLLPAMVVAVLLAPWFG
ncbi:MAG: DUF554 domain-containing protein [Solidesulfovibrio sp. DCME]|uniref:DUF554 domain-containing protein n=1 Tax=Solidesulfovibrio sp. DCME TaxID=3447380 RepID=UPI003D097F4C